MRIHFSTISILTVFTLFFSNPSFTQNPTTTDLEKRISSIEKRITILENQLSELRSELAKLKSQLKEQPNKTTTEKQNWRRLKLGMSMSEVKSLLDELDNVSGGPLTTWEYKGHGLSRGFVIFDSNGKLLQWREPD
jgi:chaperonin cofactor prefoldin